MAYTEDELNLLACVPQMIGTAIASASSSGLFGTGKELFASASSLVEGVKSYPNNSLIRQIVPDPTGDRAKAMERARKSRDWVTARMKAKGVNSAEGLRALMLEDTRAASTLLAAKASPAEASEYRQWALSLAEKVANASSEGGFLGFGGERVTAAEKALIDQVKSALGVAMSGPQEGETARAGFGLGRRAASAQSAAMAEKESAPAARTLTGRKVVITAGPTHEPIDKAHYIAKQSSGRRGYALAEAAVALGAETALVSGPVSLPLPPGAQVMMANTALDMLDTCDRELPCDIAIFAAEVAEWRVDGSSGGQLSRDQVELRLVKNPDILKAVATRKNKRPTLVVGFATETQDAIENGRKKLVAGSCDLMVAYDAGPSTEIMSSDRNTVHLISGDGVETWSRMSGREVARRLMAELAKKLAAR